MGRAERFEVAMLSIVGEVSGDGRGFVASSASGRTAPERDAERRYRVSGPKAIPANEPTWTLSIGGNRLESEGIELSLTNMETLILGELARSREAVVSKHRIIVRLGRDADRYSGLEMCMSRLQRKFKEHSGQQRLFVAVRNRGYRLTQRIRLAEWIAE